MIMDAAATPDPKFFWEFLLSIGFLLSIAANVATAVTVRRTQKREVHFGFVPASKDEFEKHVANNAREHENFFSKLGGMERGQTARMESIAKEWRTELQTQTRDILASNDEGREKLHNRITEILGEVRELKGKINSRRHES